MHVGFSLLTLFPGRVGGSESNVQGLLGQFAAGHGPDRVTVLANARVAAEYGGWARGPVSLHPVRSYRAGDSDPTRLAAMVWARLAPRIASRDVPAGLDLVHYPVTVPIPATGGPTVLTLFDVQHHDLPQAFSAAERRFRAWAYDAAARKATLVVTSSQASATRIASSVGVAADRIAVVPLGIDHARFAPDGPTVPVDLPDRYVFYPANLWPHKNHDHAVEALALMEDRSVDLVLTGQTYGRLEALLDHARRHGVADRVRHLGFVPREAVSTVYRRALAVVFPSAYEGFGSPVLEAMACGTPVASSLAASLRELAEGCAEPLDPHDPAQMAVAWDRVVADEPVRRRLRSAGLERASRYTWKAAATAHVEIYRRAMRSS